MKQLEETSTGETKVDVTLEMQNELNELVASADNCIKNVNIMLDVIKSKRKQKEV